MNFLVSKNRCWCRSFIKWHNTNFKEVGQICNSINTNYHLVFQLILHQLVHYHYFYFIDVDTEA